MTCNNYKVLDYWDVLENGKGSVPPIIKEESKEVLLNLKDGKATGIDGIPAKI